MKPRQSEGFTPFNHGYLCQMLKSATAQQLADVAVDVAKEQVRRIKENETQYTTQLNDLITKVISDGFNIKICADGEVCYISNDNIDTLSINISYDK